MMLSKATNEEGHLFINHRCFYLFSIGLLDFVQFKFYQSTVYFNAIFSGDQTLKHISEVFFSLIFSSFLYEEMLYLFCQ